MRETEERRGKEKEEGRHRQSYRETRRHKKTERDTERNRETQGDTERHREAQVNTDTDREAGLCSLQAYYFSRHVYFQTVAIDPEYSKRKKNMFVTGGSKGLLVMHEDKGWGFLHSLSTKQRTVRETSRPKLSFFQYFTLFLSLPLSLVLIAVNVMCILSHTTLADSYTHTHSEAYAWVLTPSPALAS